MFTIISGIRDDAVYCSQIYHQYPYRRTSNSFSHTAGEHDELYLYDFVYLLRACGLNLQELAPVFPGAIDSVNGG